MYELKPLHREAVAASLEKAKHYRLLNAPADAESICLDILDVAPGHQEALVVLILSLTDQFGDGLRDGTRRARECVPRLDTEYQQAYYSGIICERQAKAKLRQGFPGAGFAAYEWLQEALECFEKALALRPPNNDDAILRWNTCVRLMQSDPNVRPAPRSDSPPFHE